jgi:hypothetical protein
VVGEAVVGVVVGAVVVGAVVVDVAVGVFAGVEQAANNREIAIVMLAVNQKTLFIIFTPSLSLRVVLVSH